MSQRERAGGTPGKQFSGALIAKIGSISRETSAPPMATAQQLYLGNERIPVNTSRFHMVITRSGRWGARML
jgi:hypothetical protein